MLAYQRGTSTQRFGPALQYSRQGGAVSGWNSLVGLFATKAGAFEELAVASKCGFGEYKALRLLTKGSGLEVHHLIEQRFATTLGVDADKMESIVLTTTEHQAFTKAWLQQIGRMGSNAAITTANATKAEIEEAARQVYKNYPQIVKALGL